MKAMLPVRQETKNRIKVEATKQVQEILLRRCIDLDTVVMWVLHRRFGFGAKRCKAFFDAYKPTTDGFTERYGSDKYYKMREDLVRDGIDIERWEKEA